MRTIIDAWPFIASSNRTLDWRPILAPQFLIDTRSDYLLVTETSGPDAHSPESTKVVHNSRSGPITLLFSRSAATSELLDRRPSEPLLDGFGRPVYVVEGLVLRGHHSVPVKDRKAALQSVRALTRQHFPAFWLQEEEGVAPEASAAMQVGIDDERTDVVPPDTPRTMGGPRSLALLSAALLTLVAAVWWWRTRGS